MWENYQPTNGKKKKMTTKTQTKPREATNTNEACMIVFSNTLIYECFLT